MSQREAIITVQGEAGYRAVVEAWDERKDNWVPRETVDISVTAARGHSNNFRLAEGEAFRLWNPAEDRTDGEWFWLSPVEIEAIREMRDGPTL